MEWDVIEVKPVAPLALEVRFADGTCGRVSFEQSHLTGVFAALKDPCLFMQARVEDGAVTWPGNLDLAPDAMYVQIKQNGHWVLR